MPAQADLCAFPQDSSPKEGKKGGGKMAGTMHMPRPTARTAGGWNSTSKLWRLLHLAFENNQKETDGKGTRGRAQAPQTTALGAWKSQACAIRVCMRAVQQAYLKDGWKTVVMPRVPLPLHSGR